MQLNSKKTTQFLKIGDVNEHFFPKRHIEGQHTYKRCSTSLIIREMQIKTTVSYHPTHVKMAITKMSTNNRHWQGCGEKGTFMHGFWECKLG